MPILGAHQSIAGGFDLAVERASECGCECVQIFTKNNAQWRGVPITDQQAEKFRIALENLHIAHPIVHDSYLINLASPDPVLWKKSIDALIDELYRAEKLAIPYVVTHPGAFISGQPDDGLERIARALDEIHGQTTELHVQCLLETTAGQGTSLGWQFENFTAIFDSVQHPERLGICFDSCHVFAAGYEFRTEKAYFATFEALDQAVGLERLRAFHLNDSLRELGSRVDRHEHIGQGHLGLEPFRFLLNDSRFEKIPMYLETPKSAKNSEVNADRVNLSVLRGLV